MTFQADDRISENRGMPAAGEKARDSKERASAARESLSWIRALASQWEDDRPGSEKTRVGAETADDAGPSRSTPTR